MALVTMRQLMDHAAEHGYGLPAFNVNNLEQVKAIMEAARKTNSPVIIQASRGARSYAGDIYLKHIMLAAVEENSNIPICVHQDHGNNVKTCLSAISNNFTSVMMDGSLEEDGATPASYKYNVEVTKKVVEIAHCLGVSVEGELGCLGSLETGKGDKEDGHGFDGELSKDKLLTDPDEAVDFVKKTNVDALAVAIGTSHGAYKFSRKPDGEILAMNVIKEINNKIPSLHMVMHGSSSVPKDLQDIINKYGGKMPETYGVPVEETIEGIKHGVRKINIDTDNRMALTGQIRKFFHEKPSEFDPRKYNTVAMKKMTDFCASRYDAFGCSGMAKKIKPVSLDNMATNYSNGKLNHVFS